MPVSAFRSGSWNQPSPYSQFIDEVESIANDFTNWSARNYGPPVGTTNAANAMPQRSNMGVGINYAFAGEDMPNSPNAQKGTARSELPLELRKQFDQYRQLAEQEGVPVDNPTNKTSFLGSVFDVLSRGAYASANSFGALVEDKKKDDGQVTAKENLDIATYAIPGVGLLRGLIDAGNGQNRFDDFWDGLSGKEKVFFSDVLRESTPEMGNKQRAILGFGLDVLTDPTTWVTGGTVAGARTSARVGGKALGKSAAEKAAVKGQKKTLETVSKVVATPSYVKNVDKVKQATSANLRAAGYEEDALKVLELDFTNAETISTFFNPIRTSGPEAITRKNAGSAVTQVNRRGIAYLDALGDGLEFGVKTDLVQQGIEESIKAGRYTPETTLKELEKKAFVFEYADESFISRYKYLQGQRAHYDTLAKQGSKTAAKEAARIRTMLDNFKPEGNGRFRFTVDIDGDGQMSAYVRDIIKTDPEYTALARQRRAASRVLQAAAGKKIASNSGKARAARKEYDDLSKQMSDILAERMVRDLGMESDNIKIIAKSAKRQDTTSLIRRRKELKERNTRINRQIESYIGFAGKAGKNGAEVGGKINKAELAALKRELQQVKSQFKVVESELSHRARNNYPQWAGDKAKANQFEFDDIRAKAIAEGDDDLVKAMDDGTFVPRDRVDPDDFNVMMKTKVGRKGDDYDRLVRRNKQIVDDLSKQAGEQAPKIAEEIKTSMMDLLVRNSALKNSREISIGVGWGGARANLLALTVPGKVTKAAEKLSTIKYMKNRVDTFNKLLVSSARLGDEQKAIRAGGATVAQSVIERRLETISDVFDGVKKADRREIVRHAFMGQRDVWGGKVDQVNQYLTEIAAKFSTDPAPVGGIVPEPLKIEELSDFLPAKFKLPGKGEVSEGLEPGTLGHLLESIRVNDVLKADKDMDPSEFLWSLSVAAEQAQTRHMIRQTLVEQYGVKAADIAKDAKTGRYLNKNYDYLAQQGYRTPKGLGNQGKDVLFEPEMAAQVEKMMDLLAGPGRMNDAIRYFDKVQGTWKKYVTVYNPGFHTRSAMGDGFVAYLNGVSGPSGLKSYNMSGRVLKTFNQLGDLPPEAFANPNIFDNLKAMGGSGRSRGNQVLFKTRGGRDVTIEDIWALYIDNVGKVGFSSTEFEHLVPQGALRTNVIAKQGQKAGDFVMRMSQGREDYFRLAHFIHLMRTGKEADLKMLARNAGQTVRKYHVDYSDFTNFEKYTMARIAPFYKWTRKALPLMLENMLLRPAKVGLYPKVTYNMSQFAGYDSGQENPLGFKISPYDAIVPEWMSARGFAPIMDAEGGTVAYAPAMPFNDALNTASSAAGLQGMANPFIGLAFGGIGADANKSLPQQLAGLVPFTNQVVNQGLAKGKPLNEAVFDPTDPNYVNFLTGLGITQNTADRQASELKFRKKQITDDKKNWLGQIGGQAKGGLELKGEAGSTGSVGPFVT